MITSAMVGKVYDRINFQDHGPEGIAEGLEEIFQDHLAEILSGKEDLDAVIRAVARERVIRRGMAETGESREIVAETLDASISTGQEAVLNLMDGEPTTLRAGIQRYVQVLEAEMGEGCPWDSEAKDVVAGIADELNSLLAYPWPVTSAAPGLKVERPNDEILIVEDPTIQVKVGDKVLLPSPYSLTRKYTVEHVQGGLVGVVIGGQLKWFGHQEVARHK